VLHSPGGATVILVLFVSYFTENCRFQLLPHPNAPILFSGSRKYVDSSCTTLIGAETIKATQIRPLHAAIALFSVAHLNYHWYRVRIRFRVWMVSCYAHVFVLLSIVIVTLPCN